MGKQSLKVLQGEQSRAKLIRAAALLFGNRSYNEVSVQDICDAAGLTKGAFYHHFDGKESLYCLILTPVLDTYLARHYAPATEASPTERLVLLARCTLESSMAQGKEAAAESTISMLRQGKSSLYVEKRIHTRLLRDALTDFGVADMDAAMMMYAAFMIGVLVKWASHDKTFEPEIDWFSMLDTGIRRLFPDGIESIGVPNAR